jgi:O-acetylserine/cysteine efflux transporter
LCFAGSARCAQPTFAWRYDEASGRDPGGPRFRHLGGAFVATKIALESFSPPQLTALRFLIACLPALLLPRPRISWLLLILIGSTLFTGQFLLLFFAFINGLPPGVASVTQQMQAFFTVILAAIFLGDVPTVRQGVGMAVALVGLVLIALTIDSELSALGLALAMGGALSWAVGNVLVKRMRDTPMFALVAWLSLVPPIPALAVSSAYDQHPLLLADLLAASWTSLAAALYLGLIATTLAYAIWGRLLARYSAALVAPFALVAPCVGVVGSALVFGEVFGPIRYVGMLLVLGGLAVIVLPARSGPFRWGKKQPTAGGTL